MIANAMLSACVISLAVTFWLMEACTFLIPYRQLLWQQYRWTIGGWAAVAFINVFAASYAVSRKLFLEDTGEKLAHLERQVRSGDSVARELAIRLREEP